MIYRRQRSVFSNSAFGLFAAWRRFHRAATAGAMAPSLQSAAVSLFALVAGSAAQQFAEEPPADPRASFDTRIHSGGAGSGFVDGEGYANAMKGYRIVVLASCCGETGCEGIAEAGCAAVGAEVCAPLLCHRQGRRGAVPSWPTSSFLTHCLCSWTVRQRS